MIKSIPIQLLHFVMSSNKENEFRTFLMLKIHSSTGVLEKGGEIEKNTIRKLQISVKTYKRHLDKLSEYNFLNEDEERIFLRGWKYINQQNGIRKFTSKVELCEDYISKDKFRGYFMGALISYHCRVLNFIKREERKNEGSRQSRNIKHPLSLTYLASLLKISKSKVTKYKKDAIKFQFVHRTKNLCNTKINTSRNSIKELRANRIVGTYPINVKGKLVLVETDTYKPLLITRRFR